MDDQGRQTEKKLPSASELRSERTRLLSEMLAQLLHESDPDSVLRELFTKVGAHIAADAFLSFMIDEPAGRVDLHSYEGIEEPDARAFAELNFGAAVCGLAGASGQATTAHEIQSSPDDSAALMRRLGIRTYACIPLKVADKCFGALCFASRSRDAFDHDEVEFLCIISQYAGLAMERLRTARVLRESEEQLAQELSDMQELHQMTTRLLGMREIPSALEQILDVAMRIQNADCGKVQIYNPELQALELVAHRGFPKESLEYFRVVTSEHESASGIALRLKQRVIIEDTKTYTDHPINVYLAALAGYRAVQATPLLSRSGEILGMLSTHFRGPHRPTKRELRILDLYARQAADFIEVLTIEQELRQSEDRMRQQALELEEQLIASGRMVSLGEVTASMAHEFNNPLGVILGFAQDLLSSTDPSDPDFRALQIVEEEARRCRRIVQDLIDFSRPQPTELIPTKVDEVIRRSLSLVESSLYKHRIEVQTTLMPDLPKISADPQQLQQVLLNLLLNAIDAMPAGGKLSVTAKIEQRNGETVMVIGVSDSGVGIDKELQSKIFMPFFTAGKKHGLGLGLSICDRIVKNHRGTIEAQSDPGKGTTFKICLPADTQDSADPRS